MGLEPTILGETVRHSTHLNYVAINFSAYRMVGIILRNSVATSQYKQLHLRLGGIPTPLSLVTANTIALVRELVADLRVELNPRGL